MRPDEFERAVRNQQRDRENIASVAGAVVELYGEVPVHGAGWATFDIDFPVRFVERPTPRDGWHYVDNQVLNPRNLPAIRVSVKNFRQTNSTPIYYTGATMLVVSHGPDDLWAIAHYTLTGRALRYPLEPQNGGLGA